eukprot:m.73284 g.73284  ORF g.73284 m.73284 type:complete len:81 (-) comp18793_c1_seq1:61-303(-)
MPGILLVRHVAQVVEKTDGVSWFCCEAAVLQPELEDVRTHLPMHVQNKSRAVGACQQHRRISSAHPATAHVPTVAGSAAQ